MINRLLKRLLVLCTIGLTCMHGPVGGQQTISVVVLPFEIYAQQEFEYLQTEIPAALKSHFEQEGAKVLVLEKASDPSWNRRDEGVEDIRNLGLSTGADYIIWGSLTWVDQQFSLDAKLLQPRGDEPVSNFSAEGQGIENLPATVKELAGAISLRLFERERITSLVITGNERIEEDAIERVIQSKPGDVFSPKNISDDLKSIYSMGYFDDIRVLSETTPQGKKIIFNVEEKPTLRKIIISGNRVAYDDDEIMEVLNIKRGSILNIFKIINDVDRIEELYKEKNYYNVQVDYKIFQKENNQADVEYVIEEGKKTWITKIEFEGNKAFTDKKLKGVMSTSEKNFLSFITSAGNLNQQILEQDAAKIEAFYQNNGYMQAKVGEPELSFEDDGIHISLKVVEGPQYRVGKIEMQGDLILPEEELLQKLKITEEEVYNRELLRVDVLTLTDIYADAGYAYADIFPRTKEDPQAMIVDITFDIQQNNKVYFEEIIITGNTKTRDRVIRRELKIFEQGLFSSTRLKRSIRNLQRLDFFEDVKVNNIRGSSDDKMVVKLDVTEKSTGAFSFGGGYGNVENFFGTVSIAERNLFGRGQILELRGQIGSRTRRFNLRFTEPWLFYMPLSASLNAYSWQYEFNDYTKDSIGGTAGLGYPLFDYTRGNISYIYDISDVTDIDEEAAESIKAIEGENIKSSIRPRIRYDSRDNLFNATKGSFHEFEFEFAGLGGNVGFTKYVGETGWYFPLFWKIVSVLHGRAGYVEEFGDKILPDYEKFYMGGINSLRGFTREDLSPRDANGAEIGGDLFGQFNFELKMPLLEEAGIIGILFFDAGNIWARGEEITFESLRFSAGPEIRWLSPVGPIRLAYGFILDPEPTDHGIGNWEFSMASLF